MQEELSLHDDISLITGLKRRDNVLVIGGNIVMPFLKNYVNSITHARKTGDLNKLLQDERQFDRVFVARENVLEELIVIKAARLTALNGLVCFFSDDENMRDAFSDVVERNFPMSSVWSFDSNVGKLVVTDARGNPAWME